MGLLLDSTERRPVLHLHACHEPILAVLGLENRRFAFLHIEPLPAESINDVRLVCDEEGIFAQLCRLRQHVPKCGGSPSILVGRNNEATLRQVDALPDVLKSGEHRRFERAIKIARVDFADRDVDPSDCITKRFSQRLALVVEVTLLGDVLEIEGVGIGLIREGRAMSNKNDVSA
jgi:hypothetical protein